MAAKRVGLVGRVVRGAVAGAVGTLAMDLVWYRRSRAAGSDQPFTEYEVSTGADGFDDVGAPAETARTVASAVGAEIPESRAGVANDAVHWATGVGWGAVFGALGGLAGPLVAGPLLGTAAVATSYVVLPAIGVYERPWDYDAKTLAKDWSAHLAYGTATAVAFTLLGGRRQRSAEDPAS